MGTRFSEETESKPKPMILIDDKPILWHIMSIYAKHGFCDFVIATGYKSEVIEEWVNFEVFPEWTVRTIFTGLEAQTGGRIKKCINELDEDIFFVTYGDGLGNVNVKELLEFHKRHGKASTVTAVRPPARFGYLKSINGKVEHFGEKNQVDEGWINGGFFVINREVES